MRVVPLLMVLGLLAGPSGVASAEKRLRLSAHPGRAMQSQPVVIRFRTRETLDGVYLAQARPSAEARGCDARSSRAARARRSGRVVRLRLFPAAVEGDPAMPRWCVGVYRVKVLFKQTVRCIPRVQCGDSVARPLGSTTFTVVAEP